MFYNGFHNCDFTLASIPNICSNTPSFALSGGSPSGGSYSGTNVISNRYTAANVGLDTIKYSFTDSNTCNAEATGIIQLILFPNVYKVLKCDLF